MTLKSTFLLAFVVTTATAQWDSNFMRIFGAADPAPAPAPVPAPVPPPVQPPVYYVPAPVHAPVYYVPAPVPAPVYYVPAPVPAPVHYVPAPVHAPVQQYPISPYYPPTRYYPAPNQPYYPPPPPPHTHTYGGGSQSPYCAMQPKRGSCTSNIWRWYYDHKVQDCLQFVYGGCGGNRNNYRSRAVCQQACRYHSHGGVGGHVH